MIFEAAGSGESAVKLTDSELRHIEKLARIRLEPESREMLRLQMARIIDFVRQLHGVASTEVSTNTCIDDLKPILRDDLPGESLDREEVLSQAPESAEGCFIVPEIIEKQV